jgi:hypothetical protein
MAITQKTKITNAGEDAEKGELSYTLVGCKLVQPLLKTLSMFLTNYK